MVEIGLNSVSNFALRSLSATFPSGRLSIIIGSNGAGLIKYGYVSARISELIQTFGFQSVADKFPAKLSGGEARKAALVRALAIDPEILLLDEPFTNLDSQTRSVVAQEIMMAVKS